MIVSLTNTSDGGLESNPQTNDFDFLVLVDNTAFRLQRHQ